MAALRRLMRRLLSSVAPGREEAGLAREIASHLALLEDDYRRRGQSADEARRSARLALGGVERTKELHRDDALARVARRLRGRRPLRRPRLRPEPGLHVRRDPHAGPRHRRQHGAVHAGRPRDRERPAREGSRAAGRARLHRHQRGGQGRLQRVVSGIPDVPRGARRALGPVRLRAAGRSQCGAWRPRRAGDGADRERRHVRRPRRRAGSGTPVHSHRRRPVGAAGGRPQSRLLAAPLRRRPADRRADHPAQHARRHHRRRHAVRVSRRDARRRARRHRGDGLRRRRVRRPEQPDERRQHVAPHDRPPQGRGRAAAGPGRPGADLPADRRPRHRLRSRGDGALPSGATWPA